MRISTYDLLDKMTEVWRILCPTWRNPPEMDSERQFLSFPLLNDSVKVTLSDYYSLRLCKYVADPVASSLLYLEAELDKIIEECPPTRWLSSDERSDKLVEFLVICATSVLTLDPENSDEWFKITIRYLYSLAPENRLDASGKATFLTGWICRLCIKSADYPQLATLFEMMICNYSFGRRPLTRAERRLLENYV